MKRIGVLIAAILAVALGSNAQLTLDYCKQRAAENYPLIRKYGIVERTSEIALSDINKGWLPRVGVVAQVTAQNAVSAFPEFLENILAQNGADIAGMGKVQYKGGVELSQTVWDGGASRAQRAIERATEATNRAGLDVEMYALNARVENIFFGILLLESQIEQFESTIHLLDANHERVAAMVRSGVALPADADMIEAQALAMRQQLAEARTALKSYRAVLGIYIYEDPGERTLVRPEADMPASMVCERPELALYDKQIELNEQRRAAIRASEMPRIGFFAQANYGYPGFNIFGSIMSRDPKFNLLAGLKVSWNIDAFYTRKNSHERLNLASESVRTDRDVFMFNSRIQTAQEDSKIQGIRTVMKDDSRIVELRRSVRAAAESQLRNGVIDMTSLLSKINDENQALLTSTYHEILLLQTIYQLKHTLNQ